ncbi:hypothetical protein ABVT39_004698 [Epinephelus coioides]
MSSSRPIKYQKQSNPNNNFCCVPQCTMSGKYNSTVSFHRFPKDETLRKIWIHNVKTRSARSTRANLNNGLCFGLKVIILWFHSFRFASYRHLQAFWRQIEPATWRIVPVGMSSTSSTTAAPDKAADPPRPPVGTSFREHHYIFRSNLKHKVPVSDFWTPLYIHL